MSRLNRSRQSVRHDRAIHAAAVLLRRAYAVPRGGYLRAVFAVFAAVAALGSVSPALAVDYEELTALLRAGIGEAVIEAQIEREGLEFTPDSAQLIALKEAGAGDRLLTLIASAPTLPRESARRTKRRSAIRPAIVRRPQPPPNSTPTSIHSATGSTTGRTPTRTTAPSPAGTSMSTTPATAAGAGSTGPGAIGTSGPGVPTTGRGSGLAVRPGIPGITIPRTAATIGIPPAAAPGRGIATGAAHGIGAAVRRRPVRPASSAREIVSGTATTDRIRIG